MGQLLNHLVMLDLNKLSWCENCSNINGSIQNAVAVRKINKDAINQTEQLANYLFSKSDIQEITLVGTQCISCKRRFSALKL